jgi:hypothetical protein
MENNKKYAACATCRKQMAPKNGCLLPLIIVNGEKYERIKAGDVLDFNPCMGENDVCHDCNVGVNQYHHFGCDAERCPVCSNQLLSCDCDDSVYLVITVA